MTVDGTRRHSGTSLALIPILPVGGTQIHLVATRHGKASYMNRDGLHPMPQDIVQGLGIGMTGGAIAAM